MKKTRRTVMVIATAVVVGCISCQRDQYDEAFHQEYMDSISPVDSIDAAHDWELTQRLQVAVNANVEGAIAKVQILSSDPRKEGAQIIAQAPMHAGGMKTLAISCPKLNNQLYAALVDSAGRYTVTQFYTFDSGVIDFASPLYSDTHVDYTPEPQGYAFCYDEELSQTNADYDYNDVVLHIAQERTGELEMRYHVTLEAIGSTQQLAAALNLPQVGFDDVVSVTTVGGESFNLNNGNELRDQMILVKSELKKQSVFKGRNGEAVVSLFADAHWATGDIIEENYGLMTRKYYNVSRASSDDYQVMVPRTVTYIVTFKQGTVLNQMTLNDIDPFIIVGFNGAFIEVHPYPYRRNAVVYEGWYPDIRTLPWSLTIPTTDFHHPLEGCNIGFKKGKFLGFGAYPQSGHSFGEWAEDMTQATDWYLSQYRSSSNTF